MLFRSPTTRVIVQELGRGFTERPLRTHSVDGCCADLLELAREVLLRFVIVARSSALANSSIPRNALVYLPLEGESDGSGAPGRSLAQSVSATPRPPDLRGLSAGLRIATIAGSCVTATSHDKLARSL